MHHKILSNVIVQQRSRVELQMTPFSECMFMHLKWAQSRVTVPFFARSGTSKINCKPPEIAWREKVVTQNASFHVVDVIQSRKYPSNSQARTFPLDTDLENDSQSFGEIHHGTTARFKLKRSLGLLIVVRGFFKLLLSSFGTAQHR